MSHPLNASIARASASALARSKSFAEATGVSDEERREELTKVRKATGPGAAERVSLRFAKVVAAFKEGERRSPGVEDGEVWKALTQIVREEIGA